LYERMKNVKKERREEINREEEKERKRYEG
jgi:hypothetical protein